MSLIPAIVITCLEICSGSFTSKKTSFQTSVTDRRKPSLYCNDQCKFFNKCIFPQDNYSEDKIYLGPKAFTLKECKFGIFFPVEITERKQNIMIIISCKTSQSAFLFAIIASCVIGLPIHHRNLFHVSENL